MIISKFRAGDSLYLNRGNPDSGKGYGCTLDKLGDRARAIEYAQDALKIKEQIEAPNVVQVREQLAAWRGKK